MKALPRYLLQKINYCWAFVVEKDTPVKVPVTRKLFLHFLVDSCIQHENDPSEFSMTIFLWRR